MTRRIPRRLIAALASFSFLIPGAGSHAADLPESYPNRPIKLLYGFSTGGPADYVTRLVGRRLAQELGQPVIVESKPGASSTIATNLVAQAPGDGYTIMMGAMNQAVNPSLLPDLPFDQQKDLRAIAIAAFTPNVLVVSADSSIASVDEIVARARRAPGSISYGSSGVGTSVHLAGALFGMTTGAELIHVPYKGIAPAELDVVAGRVTMLFDSVVSAKKLIDAGRLKAFAVSSANRSALLPDVPTMAELGWQDFDVSPWYAFFAPASTPDAIVERLNAIIVATMSDPQEQANLLAQGVEPRTSTAREADAYVAAEIGKWGELVRRLELKPE